MNSELIKFLSQFVTKRRFELFEKVIENRTRYMTVVLEDIYQPHNASAVLRSCDCFGIQDVHIIENRNTYTVSNDVSAGSSKWLNLHYHNSKENNSLQAIQELKKSNYRIVATTPHTDDVELPNFDVSKGKFALFFGSEMPGLTDEIMNNADEFLKIPMYGFTESFNISVSAAIIFQHLTMKLHQSEINWQLNSKNKNLLTLEWLKKSIREYDSLVKRFENEK